MSTPLDTFLHCHQSTFDSLLPSLHQHYSQHGRFQHNSMIDWSLNLIQVCIIIVVSALLSLSPRYLLISSLHFCYFCLILSGISIEVQLPGEKENDIKYSYMYDIII